MQDKVVHNAYRKPEHLYVRIVQDQLTQQGMADACTNYLTGGKVTQQAARHWTGGIPGPMAKWNHIAEQLAAASERWLKSKKKANKYFEGKAVSKSKLLSGTIRLESHEDLINEYLGKKPDQRGQDG
jgi:hypothetical protein